jgi:hypothetical protein
MTGGGHRLFALLAILGLLSALGWSATAIACPSDAAHVAQPSEHGHGCSMAAPASTPAPAKTPTPLDHALAACPACLAVLPSLVAIEAHPALPLAPVSPLALALYRFDPGLDPPPPRSA